MLTKSVAIDISFRRDGISSVTSRLDNAIARNNCKMARYNGMCRVMSNTGNLVICEGASLVIVNSGKFYLNHFLSTSTRQELGKNVATNPKILVEVPTNRQRHHDSSYQCLYNHLG